jgi:hypothetical protein
MTTTDSANVHVVAYALWPRELEGSHKQEALAWQQALHARRASPALAQLALTRIIAREHLDADSACMAHEMVWANAMGWQTAPELLPLAAWQAGQLGLLCPPEHGWALIDLVHLQFEQGRVQMSLPVDLSTTDSDALLQAMQPFFLEDGIHLHPISSGRFLAHATVFKQLPCVTLERGCWQGMNALNDSHQVAAQSPAQRMIRRLQNEMQMLFYTHAVNETRDQPVNSFWVSGCGDLPATTAKQVVLHQRLRQPFVQAQPAEWATAWEALAHEVMLPGLQQGDQVVLCGTDHALHLQVGQDQVLHRLRRFFKPVQLIQHLS